MPDKTTHPPEAGQDDPSPGTSKGNTTTGQGEHLSPVPRMPHERDESADSQPRMAPWNRRLGEKAQADVEAGRTDTSKGAEMDSTYDKLRADLPDGDKQFRP